MDTVSIVSPKKTIWHDRFEAGRDLAVEIHKMQYQSALVCGLARGGMEVAYQVAMDTGFSLNVLIVRKIGAPAMPELAIGAVSEQSIVLNYFLIEKMGISEDEIQERVRKEQKDVERRVSLYRRYMPYPDIPNRVVLLVDDGTATGMTAEAAIAAVRMNNPKKVVYVSPVASPDAIKALSHMADTVITLLSPADFQAVGNYYHNFSPVTDKTVINILKKFRPH